MIFSCQQGWVDKVELPHSSSAVNFGRGLFETMRSYSDGLKSQKIGFVKEHITRLFEGIQEIGLPVHLTKEALQDLLQEAIAKAPKGELQRIKILALEEDLLIQMIPLQLDESIQQGVNLMAVSWSRSLPHLKSTSYLDALHAQQKAVEQECYDALMTDQRGFITETSKANVFWVKDSQIYTTTENALPGIIQDFFLKQKNLNIKTQTVTLEELQSAEEVMLTNSIIGIIPVHQIQGPAQRQALSEEKPLYSQLSKILQQYTHDH